MQIPQAVDAVEALKSSPLAGAVDDVHVFRDETTIVVKPEQVVNVARYLRDTPGLIFNYLSDISAVDYYPDYYNRPGRFGVAYHLYSMLYNRRVRLKVYLLEDDPRVPTMATTWNHANWLEREILDLMGITFEGHPDPRRILLPEDWDGHPARRDYPLGYETVMFSFNQDEITKHKPHADE